MESGLDGIQTGEGMGGAEVGETMVSMKKRKRNRDNTLVELLLRSYT